MEDEVWFWGAYKFLFYVKEWWHKGACNREEETARNTQSFAT